MLNMHHPLVAKLAEDATRAGLLVSQFNSGTTRNESNGFRLFLAEGAPWKEPDHFCGLHRQCVQAAVAVWRADDNIDAHYNSLFRELLTYMIEDPRTISSGAHLLFIAKNLERIGDHGTNIAEHIHFVVTGEDIGTERPRVDAESGD